MVVVLTNGSLPTIAVGSKDTFLTTIPPPNLYFLIIINKEDE